MSRKKPVVCVRKVNNAIETDPPVIETWRRFNGKSVKITWVAAPKETAKLKISFLQSGCITDDSMKCKDNECSAQTDTTSLGHYECYYVVELNGSTIDPLVIIDD